MAVPKDLDLNVATLKFHLDQSVRHYYKKRSLLGKELDSAALWDAIVVADGVVRWATALQEKEKESWL